MREFRIDMASASLQGPSTVIVAPKRLVGMNRRVFSPNRGFLLIVASVGPPRMSMTFRMVISGSLSVPSFQSVSYTSLEVTVSARYVGAILPIDVRSPRYNYSTVVFASISIVMSPEFSQKIKNTLAYLLFAIYSRICLTAIINFQLRRI